MNDLKMDGTGNISGGEYGKVEIGGITKCIGNLKAECVKIDGIFSCDGDLETDLLDCDGKAEFWGNIRAKKIDLDGLMHVKKGSKIEAEEIYADGLIKVNGEISADKIELTGGISAKEVFGDSIKIHYKEGAFSRWFTKKIFGIDLMEATDIDLIGITVTEVNGKNIRIGKRCKIKRIDCSGTLHIDEKATVEEIHGDYTIVE